MMAWHRDNVATFEVAAKAAVVSEAPAPLTKAQQRLARYRAETATETVRRVNLPGDDEPFFVIRGNFSRITMAAQLSGRDKNGVLSLSDVESLSGFIAALLRTFTVNSEADQSPYFETLSDARNFVDDCAGSDAVSMLFYGIVDLNPEVFLKEALKDSSTPPSSAPKTR